MNHSVPQLSCSKQQPTPDIISSTSKYQRRDGLNWASAFDPKTSCDGATSADLKGRIFIPTHTNIHKIPSEENPPNLLYIICIINLEFIEYKINDT